MLRAIYDEKIRLTQYDQTLADDRSYQAKCSGTKHEFAPGAYECACRKYGDRGILKNTAKPVSTVNNENKAVSGEATAKVAQANNKEV